MNIDNLTIGEAKQLAQMFGGSAATTETLNSMVGEKVIIRTYSAGVHFGTLVEKAGNEVILKDSRRLWRWHCKTGISLSSVALHGVDQSKSRIADALPSLWLEAIEIIPCSAAAVGSIEGAPVSEQD